MSELNENGFEKISTKEADRLYEKKNQFCEKIKRERAEAAFKQGKYKTFEEAFEHTGDVNFFSYVKSQLREQKDINDEILDLNKNDRNKVYDVVKKICFKKVINKSDEFKTLSMAMSYVVKNVLEITPRQFYSIYSVEKLKKYSLYGVVLKIADLADIETKKQCMFDIKMTFFKSVWPDDFKDKQTDAKDIFFADENIKSGLKKAGQTKTIKEDKINGMGNIVDNILMDAINDVLFTCNNFDTVGEIFQFLSEESTKYFEKGKNHAGICDIIADRQYPSLLDFYYMNCPVKFQLDNIREYKTYRQVSKIPPNKMIETAIEIKLREIEKKEFDEIEGKEVDVVGLER